jgi:hypothetical protein
VDRDKVNHNSEPHAVDQVSHTAPEEQGHTQTHHALIAGEPPIQEEETERHQGAKRWVDHPPEVRRNLSTEAPAYSGIVPKPQIDESLDQRDDVTRWYRRRCHGFARLIDADAEHQHDQELAVPVKGFLRQ